MLMQRTGVERLIMGCTMRDTARAFVEASLREQIPQATTATIRKGLFLRFYGHGADVRKTSRRDRASGATWRLKPAMRSMVMSDPD